MTPYETVIDYLEDIANRHPDVKSYHEITVKELLANQLEIQLPYPCIFLEVGEVQTMDNRTNTDAFVPVGVGVMKPANPQNYADYKQKYIETEKIITDIISRIRKDDRTTAQGVDRDNITYNRVGPMFTDNLIGWRLEFNYRFWTDLEYNENDWNAYDPNKFS